MRVEMKIHGIEGVLDTLHRLPKEVISKRGGPVARSLGKGARFIRDRAKDNLRAQLHGSDESTGLLMKNVVANRGKAPNIGKGERYLVRVRRVAYPRRYKGRAHIVTTRKAAMWKEYGTSDQTATPWLRPAVQMHAMSAINMITADLKRRIDAEVMKLARKNSAATRL